MRRMAFLTSQECENGPSRADADTYTDAVRMVLRRLTWEKYLCNRKLARRRRCLGRQVGLAFRSLVYSEAQRERAFVARTCSVLST